jgi:hypothetical protein
MKKLWLLNDLFIKEAFRGRGFSAAPMKEAKKLCRQSGAYGFVPEIEKTNLIGNHLYLKMNLLLDTAHYFCCRDV